MVEDSAGVRGLRGSLVATRRAQRQYLRTMTSPLFMWADEWGSVGVCGYIAPTRALPGQWHFAYNLQKVFIFLLLYMEFLLRKVMGI